MPRTPSSRKPHNLLRTRHFEPLEPRLVLFATTGYEWADPNVSFSYIPEGATAEGYTNVLYSKLDGIAPTEVWQREFARALQTWANVSNLNFHKVADNGDPSGNSSNVQDNGRFGDIRLGAHALDGPLAYAYYPVSYNDLGGDIFIDPKFNYQVGSGYDVYSVLLHEAGHSIGLGHTSGTVMNSSYQGILTDLSADDIAGVQSIYGARSEDAYDATARNDSLGSAATLELNADGSLLVSADLTFMSDVDYYTLVAPNGTDGSLTVSVDASGYSLLAPSLSVYNAAGQLIKSVDAGAAYGTTAELTLSGVAAGDVFYVMADGATSDEFGMGAYRLGVDFGGGSGNPNPTPDPDPDPTPDPPGSPAADSYESNDTLATATSLGRSNGVTVTDATLHTSSDVDYYSFTARKSGNFQITAQADGGSAVTLTVYDSSGSAIASSSSGALSLNLPSNAATYVSVESPSGELDLYDLVFEKIGGGNKGKGGPKGGKGGRLEPDMYFAGEASRDLLEKIHQHDFAHGVSDDLATAARAAVSHAFDLMSEGLPVQPAGASISGVRSNSADHLLLHTIGQRESTKLNDRQHEVQCAKTDGGEQEVEVGIDEDCLHLLAEELSLV